MSGRIIGDDFWNQLTEVEKTAAVRSGRATLRQLSAGLLDGPDELRAACRDVLSHTDTSFTDFAIEPADDAAPAASPATPASSASSKQRCGLPDGFELRGQRSGRTALLPENIYQLPDGREFIPLVPDENLGSARHQYVLLTLSQYDQGECGSVFVRLDGRVFDYGSESTDAVLDSFDTGFTIDDLQRTGKYAPSRNGQC